VLGKATWKGIAGGLSWFLLAALTIGSLRPTNTWDLPPYLVFGIAAVLYGFWIRPDSQRNTRSPEWWIAIPSPLRRLLASIGGAAILIVLALLLFAPYAHWYTLGYTKIDLWNGRHTPASAYLNHWVLFLVVIVPWMIWETRDWLAKTPISALRRLSPYRFAIQFFVLLVFLAAVLLVFWREVSIGWFVLPLAAWAGVLILRQGQPDAKRAVLFLVGSGLLLTLMVEVIVLRGDIGRMNTVFKFYLQVWTMFAISAASALAWLWPALSDWRSGWRYTWQFVFFMILAGTSLYPMMATMAKIEDRISGEAPPSLDGMSFMEYASYTDSWGAMDLSQDYRAIRWMQENVKGSPVIVEANLRDLYRWGSRFSIYTGLPGVVGWEWHQQQQRTTLPGSWVSERIFEVENFYLTDDWEQAADFLRKYNVRYIIVGHQERGKYPGPGLEKFELANGVLWQEVYREGATVIYEVNEAAR
jgi:YYY domain-containing protein